MSENISPETAERIRALCRQISVSHNLDEEIQRELYSHMEDKLLGYLSGAEKVTEEDALILVQEHFGKPEVIKEMFHETHGGESAVSLLRRLGAITAASLVVGCAIQLLQMICGIFLLMKQVEGKPDAVILNIFTIIFILLPFMMLWGVLRVWKRKMERGRRLWFYRIERERFILVLILFSSFSLFLFSLHEENLHMIRFGVSILESSFIQMVLQSFLWFWWCDNSPRRYRALLAGALCWGFYNCVISMGKAVCMEGFSALMFIGFFNLLFFSLLIVLIMMGFYIIFSHGRTIIDWFEGGIAH